MFLLPYLILTACKLVLIKCDTDNIIDVDDILSENFMPGTLLMLENPKESLKSFNESIQANITQDIVDGSFTNAMETMDFHRSKMNEYLCRSYIAEQIISDMTLSRMKRRMGTDDVQLDPKTGMQVLAKTELLKDEGSSNYKDWLSKSTTLEDIYRHYDGINNRVDDHSDENDKEDEVNEDFDGHITGYAYQPQPGPPPAKVGHSGGGYYPGGSAGGGPYPYSQPGNSHGGSHEYPYPGPVAHSGPYSTGGSHFPGGSITIHSEPQEHSAYGGGHEEHIVHHEPPKYQVIHEESHSEKDHDLSELFEIALTALAFLSFGMFIIHVVMCISTVQNPMTTATGMMMPMSMSPTSTGMTGTGGGGGTGGTGGMSMGDTGGGMTGDGVQPGTGPGTGDGGGDGGTDGGGGDGADGGDGDGGGGDGGDGDGDADGGDGGDGDGGDGDGGGGDADGGTGTGTAADGAATGTGDGSASAAETGDGGTGDGGTATGGGTGGDTFKFRVRRDMPTIVNPDNRALNELAQKILTSIEAAVLANEDDGNCLRNVLCENNKYSRGLEGRNKIIIPVWSLGMSWISGRLTKNVNPATSMLDTLKASVLGLGKANCGVIYQNCNLIEQKKEMRRRRKK